MTVREKIAGVLEQYAGFDRFAEEEDPHIGTQPTLDGATDRIIALITEALLSEEAVEAGLRSLWSNRLAASAQRGAYIASVEELAAAAGLTVTGGQG